MGNAAVVLLAGFGGAGGAGFALVEEEEREAAPGGRILDYLFGEAAFFGEVLDPQGAEDPEEAAERADSLRSLAVCRGWRALVLEWRRSW